MMESSGNPPQSAGSPTHAGVLILLVPSVIGFLCSVLSQANPGGAWWLFAGFGNAVGVLGLAVAVLVALVAAGRRRISGQILLLILLEIGAATVVSWLSAKLVKSPW
jgi:hypothetical protein